MLRYFTALLVLASYYAKQASNLLPDDVDPQLLDGQDHADIPVEWLSAGELKRRMLQHQGQRGYENVQERLKAAAAASLKEKSDYFSEKRAGYARETAQQEDEGAKGPGGRRRLQTSDEVATGPLFPVFEDDLAPNLTAVFGMPPTLFRPSGMNPVPPPELANCDAEAAALCGPALSQCLGLHLDVSQRAAACLCFQEHGRCFRRTGCIELLPRADVRFCYNRLFCNRDLCMGNGVGALGPVSGVGGWVTVVTAAMATAVLAWQAR